MLQLFDGLRELDLLSKKIALAFLLESIAKDEARKAQIDQAQAEGAALWKEGGFQFNDHLPRNPAKDLFPWKDLLLAYMTEHGNTCSRHDAVEYFQSLKPELKRTSISRKLTDVFSQLKCIPLSKTGQWFLPISRLGL